MIGMVGIDTGNASKLQVRYLAGNKEATPAEHGEWTGQPKKVTTFTEPS